VDRGQAQSATTTTTTTGKVKRWPIPSINTFMKRLRQGGIIIADSSEIRSLFVNIGIEGMRNSIAEKGLLLILILRINKLVLTTPSSY
jgi:hypothetical protein